MPSPIPSGCQVLMASSSSIQRRVWRQHARSSTPCARSSGDPSRASFTPIVTRTIASELRYIAKSCVKCLYTPKTKICHGGNFIIPPEQRSCWGVYWFQSVRPSVRLSVRLSRLPCPLCNIYSSGWILSILATNDHYYERVCRTQWPLTLTYIFKVIWPWLRKSCPLCSVYSSRWILTIFGTNDHYH